MICLDTNFLIALWRSRSQPDHPVRQSLSSHAGEELVVCLPVAGEFLEGAAYVSAERFRQAMAFLHLFGMGDLSMETAARYAHVASDLRRRNLLAGVSKADLWIAAWALQHHAFLATQNVRHFHQIPGLRLIHF